MPRKPPRPAPGSGDGERRRAVREQQQRAAAAAKRRRNLIQLAVIAGVALVVIAIVGAAVIIGNRGKASTSAGGAPTANTTVTVDNVSVPFAIDGSAVRVGPANAKARVDLWVDYSCPHCQEFEADNNAALNTLIAGGDVAVSYHNIQIHSDYGTVAGGAAACVATHDPNHWVPFNASLYTNQSTETQDWNASQLRDFAGQQGINSAALDCIGASTYPGWIASNTADATKQGVEGTPTMFVNGQQTATLSGQALITKVKQLAGH